MNRNWLEPPEWWKRHKPLRWLLVFAVLLFVYAKYDEWRDHRAATATAPTPSSEPSQPAPVAAERAPEPAVAVEPPTPIPPPPAERAPRPAPIAETPPEPRPTPDPMARYTQVESARVTLMTQRSYDGVAAVTEALQRSGHSAQLSTQERKQRRNYPPHRLDTLEIAEYQHLGSVGKLKLEFFNDRLYEAYFEPKKAGDYLYKLRKQTKLKRADSGRVEHVQGHLRIASNIDLAESEVGKALKVSPFILWQDLRLTQQMKDWGPIR